MKAAGVEIIQRFRNPAARVDRVGVRENLELFLNFGCADRDLFCFFSTQQVLNVWSAAEKDLSRSTSVAKLTMPANTVSPLPLKERWTTYLRRKPQCAAVLLVSERSKDLKKTSFPGDEISKRKERVETQFEGAGCKN